MLYPVRSLLTLLLLVGNCYSQSDAIRHTSLGDQLGLIESNPESVIHDGVLLNTERPLRQFKPQAIQKISISGGWLNSVDGPRLNSGFLKSSIGLGIPLGSFDNILGVSPSFRVDWFDTDPGLDVPSELYDVGVDFFYRKRLSNRLSMMSVVRPSVRSDFSTSDQAFRIFALGLINWDCIPERLVLSGGAVYLDRADLPVLPAVGLVWTPNVRTKLDLRFPRSRLSYRLNRCGNDSETWSYLSLGLGGNTWAVTRETDQTDELSVRDLRANIGIQRLMDGGGGWFCEFGYAFARELEFEETDEDISLGDAVLVQAGWNY